MKGVTVPIFSHQLLSEIMPTGTFVCPTATRPRLPIHDLTRLAQARTYHTPYHHVEVLNKGMVWGFLLVNFNKFKHTASTTPMLGSNGAINVVNVPINMCFPAILGVDPGCVGLWLHLLLVTCSFGEGNLLGGKVYKDIWLKHVEAMRI